MSGFAFGGRVCRVLCLLALAAGVAVAEDAASSLYYSANALYNRKLYTLAVGEYKAFLERHPGHEKTAHAKHGLALSYYSLEKYAEAEPLLDEVIQGGTVGDDARLRVIRGQCLLRLDRAADAAPMFDAVVKHPQAGDLKPVALAGLAEAHFRESDWTGTVSAADALVALPAEGDLLVRGLYQGGYARQRLGQYAEAVPVLTRLVDLAGDGALKQQGAFLLGECLRETGKLEAAVKHYRLAQDLEGAGDEVNYRLGYVLFVLRRYDEALAAFQASLEQAKAGPFADSARIYMARTLLEKGKPGDAVACLTPLVDHDAHGAEAALWLARALVDQSKPAAAAERLKAAIAAYPSSPILRALRFDYANALIANGDYAAAAPLLKALIDDPAWSQQADTRRLYAACLHHGGDYAASLALCDAFLASEGEDGPYVGEVQFVRSENLYLLDRLDEAFAAYERFAARHKDSPRTTLARVRMARIHHRQSRWEKALALAQPLLESVNDPEPRLDLRFIAADAAFRLEKWADAAPALEQFIQDAGTDDPRLDSAWMELAIARARSDNEAGAVEAYRHLVENFPKSIHRAAALAELGRTLYERKAYAEARKPLEACLAAEPKAAVRAGATYTLGWVAVAEKKRDEAIEHFQWISAHAADHPLAPEALLQTGFLQLAAGQYPEARQALQAFLTANAKHADAPAALYSLGVAEARSEAWQSAVNRFKAFVEANPESPYAASALYEWAWCARELKQPAEAHARYAALLEQHGDSPLVPKVRVERAEMLYDAKDFKACIESLEKALDGMQDAELREQALYRLGMACFNLEQYGKSATVFETLVKERPDSALAVSARLQAGESRLKRGETVAARGHFETVVAAGPEAAVLESALLRLAEAQSLTGQWPESAQSYAGFLTQFPKSAWRRRALFGQAFAIEKQGQYEPALAGYAKVLEAAKKDELAARSRFQTGESLFALKRYDEAVKELIRVTVDYNYPEWTAKALLEVGRVLEAKGDTDLAMDQFREVIAKYPDHEVGTVAKERLDALRRSL